MRELKIGIVGATGAVGREMLSILGERIIPCKNIKLLASERSSGEELKSHLGPLEVETLTEDSFKDIDIALFSAGSEVSRHFGPIAAKNGTIVIDNSSTWRMDKDVPLIVPEVNSDILRDHLAKNKSGFIIANPNCSTIQLVVVLKPLKEKFGLERVVVSTYQSVSGAGKKGMDELWNQTLALFNQGKIEPQKFPHQIAFNCIPHIDSFVENGYTKEEMKVIQESRKILGEENLRITCTAVRVPTFTCHAESVNIQLKKDFDLEEIKSFLEQSPGIIVEDNPTENQYPLGFEVVGTDATYVGRIRKDESIDRGINLWIVADNLRKGAALNAVQIMEICMSQRFGQLNQ